MSSRSSTKVLVIGGGVAGLSAAWQLARAGAAVTLVEREPLPCMHSSGRNAAIFRHAEPLPELCALALRSRGLLDELCGGTAWLEVRGALYVAKAAGVIDALEASARSAGVAVVRCSASELRRRCPALEGGAVRAGLSSPADGVMDIHLVGQRLAAAARELGARLRFGAGVERLLVEGGRLGGVALDDGSRLAADVVVLAAGAWAASLAERAGAALPLTPLRRHLVQLDLEPEQPKQDGPVVWRLDEEVYFRAEGKGLLASPGDEEPFVPCLPPAAPEVLEALAGRLAALAPPLAGARVRRSWACLRTFAPDRNLVVGGDPRLPGLAWLAGLGGHGMTLSAAAAELLTAEVVHGRPPMAALSPTRLLEEEPAAATGG